MAKGSDVTVGWYIIEQLVRARDQNDKHNLDKVIDQIKALWEIVTKA